MDTPVKDNNVKFDIKAQQADFLGFINAVKTVPQVAQTSYTPADEKNHFIIYKFSEGKDKCVVVYDTKAEKISLTALPNVLERFKQLYVKRDSILSESESDKRESGKNRLPVQHKGVSALPSKKAEKGNTLPAKQPSKQIVKKDKKAQPPVKPQEKKIEPKPQEKPSETVNAEYKNGYAVKNYARKRLDDALKAIKAMRGVTYKTESATGRSKPDETETYIVSGKDSQKVILRYLPKKQVIQMQGKRSYLFSEVQVLISKDTDFKSAVGSHIELTAPKKNDGAKGTANTQSAVQRRLKKLLPNAFDFLCEQSKIDLAIGLVDINNDTKLSDYSSLLTPPYRGLEKFISDLQRARGIEVKMIGQGYEKDDDGNYRLKSGYRKRIDSVVYNEVMSALYTEYFARRNFYTHSDIYDAGVPRIISDKAEAKKIFDRLISVIDYNSKKLKEIGFTLK